METIQKKLQLIFWIPIALSAIIIVSGELDIIPNGILANDKQVEFVIMSMMEILTIIAIPVALKPSPTSWHLTPCFISSVGELYDYACSTCPW